MPNDRTTFFDNSLQAMNHPTAALMFNLILQEISECTN